jgi:uncharacterized protein
MGEPLDDIFVIPIVRDKYMVYSPKARILLSTDKDSLPNISKALRKKNSKEKSFRIQRKNNNLLLCLTNDCNLKCRYCYANGGEKEATMTADLAKQSVDYVLSKNKTKHFSLSFHGAGEPTLAVNLMKEIVEYAKLECENKGIRPRFSSVTNGVVEENTLKWLLENFERINISLDGPPDIQDSQRPLLDGGPSHQLVENTVRTALKSGKSFGIRATITKNSVNRMVEIVQYFHQLGIKNVHVEPVNECGRCLKTKVQSPSVFSFLRNYKKAFEEAEKLGIRIFCSGCDISKSHLKFCGAAGDNFIVTPEGNVTSCLEVLDEDNPLSSVFIYGKYDFDLRKFCFFREKLRRLSSRTVNKIEDCQKCFIKYNCAGGCLAKGFSLNKSLFKPVRERCDLNREMVFYTFRRIVEKNAIRMDGFQTQNLDICNDYDEC